MSSLTAVVLAGAATGSGVWLMWSGWIPARRPLAQTLMRLGQPVVEIAPERDNVDVRVGMWARRIGPVERIIASMRTDLRVLRRAPDEQAALIVVYTLCGFLWAPVVAAGGYLVGVHIPIGIPFWLAVAGAALGAVSSIRTVRTQAAERRRMFSHALGSFCDVAGMCLASGRGIDASIQTAAAAGDGWPFAELQATLRTGYVRGETPWEALSRLADECDLTDLTELAAALSLAGDEGAAVRDTVCSKAKSIRERLTANAERDAASITERMGIPATLLLLGFMIFLGFPAIYVLNALPTGRPTTPVRRKATAMTAIIVWFQTQLIEVRARAAEEADRGEIVEKVIIVAAAAAIAIAAMAAIAAAVDIKIAGLEL